MVTLALLCSAFCLLGLRAALRGQRQRAHAANAAVLGLCAGGSMLALAINPDSGAHAAGLLAWLLLTALAVSCALAARADSAWAWFWPAWLLSAAAAALLLYLWLAFRISEARPSPPAPLNSR
jgi:hypothetical protein